jgi:NAD-dependent DNA ligase
VASKKVEHFAKALKIKGLGPMTIKKLGVDDISELYTFTQPDLAKALSSEKIAVKLYRELENSKKAPLNMVLPAFSIPLIGRTAAEKLSIVCESIYDIRDETCRRAGLGPKATANLVSWLENDFPSLQDALPFDFKFERKALKEVKGVVCISGRLKSFASKAMATDALQEAGYEVKSSMTKAVTLLINESGIESAKTKRARESGITIVTNLKELIGEN